ncbi:DUF1887 family protein [Helicobacter pylori H13-1]|uniref:Card1-like endonuclease domain-containing protein n=1 Tax=Helicobacter pylori TaxID=210 RepID=UPI0003F76629|nr:DUF1887 family CARF protein [Helicobacter pylori]NOJ65270.1 DUF1887 family protein [Helicobacter pylori H13-1]
MDKSNKLVIINRAIPGGGKTSLIKQIEELAKNLRHSISVHSTDEYFIQIDEEGIRRYVFDKKKLNEYHQNNQKAFKQALENCIDIVVCDNTNFESWQSKPYTDMARAFGYKILLIDFKPRELELHLEAQRVTKERPDAHQVDKDVLERMHKEHRISSPCLDKTKILRRDTLENPMDYGWDIAQCVKKPRGIAKHYDYDFYLERVPVEQEDYERQNRELSLKALEFLKCNFDFDVIFYSFGEQLMPIFLGMRQFSAQKHVFITSSSKNNKALKRFFEERKKTNENFQINTDRLHSIEVDVFEPKNIYENILEYTKKHGLKDKRLCFNLTGGTKMMFLAGLKASEYFQAPYFYIEQRAQQLLFFKNPSDIEPFIIPAIPIKDVETFFSLHVPNRRIKQNGIIDEKSLEKIQERKNLSSLLYEYRARIIPLYQRINKNHAKDKTINICENNLKLFYKDHQVCVNIDGKEIKLKYSEDEDDFRKYIIGGWFEEYIYFELLDLLDKQAIYDLRLNMILGVGNTNAIQGDKHPIYAELDIAFSDGKNLYIVECKSGKLKEKGVLTALSTNTQIFGGANAKCILISSDDNLGQGLQEKVKILNIKFIFKDFKKNIENYISASRR